MSWRSTCLHAEVPDLPDLAFRKAPGKNRPATLEGGGKGGGKMPAPDPLIGQSMKQMADVASQQQGWLQSSVWPELLSLNERAQDVSERQVGMQERIQGQQLDQGNYYFDRFKTKQAPLEDRIISDALQYNSEAEADARAARAQTDVAQQFGLSRAATQRGLRRMGVNPGSPQAVAALKESGLAEAAAKAQATSSVREAAKQIGWARLTDAAALGRGLPGFSSNSAQIASGAGVNALNAGLAPVGAFNQSAGTMNAGYAGVGGLWGNVASAGNQMYSTQMRGYETQRNNDPLNTILGAAAGVGTGWGLSKLVKV